MSSSVLQAIYHAKWSCLPGIWLFLSISGTIYQPLHRPARRFPAQALSTQPFIGIATDSHHLRPIIRPVLRLEGNQRSMTGMYLRSAIAGSGPPPARGSKAMRRGRRGSPSMIAFACSVWSAAFIPQTPRQHRHSPQARTHGVLHDDPRRNLRRPRPAALRRAATSTIHRRPQAPRCRLGLPHQPHGGGRMKPAFFISVS